MGDCTTFTERGRCSDGKCSLELGESSVAAIGQQQEIWSWVVNLSPPPQPPAAMDHNRLVETVDAILHHCLPLMDPTVDEAHLRSWIMDQADGNLMVHQWLACIAIELTAGSPHEQAYADLLGNLHAASPPDVFATYEEWLTRHAPPYGPGCPLCGDFSEIGDLVRIVRQVHLLIFLRYAKNVKGWPIPDKGPVLGSKDDRELKRLFMNYGPLTMKTSNAGGPWRRNAWATTKEELERLDALYAGYADNGGSPTTFIIQSLGLSWDPAEEAVRIEYLEKQPVAKPTAIHRSWDSRQRHYFLPSSRENDRGRTRPTHRDCPETSMQEFVHLPIAEGQFKAHAPNPVNKLSTNWDGVSDDGYVRMRNTAVA